MFVSAKIVSTIWRAVILPTLLLVVLLLTAAWLVTYFENGNGHIDTLWDGVWWAATTVTTVGYGDEVPLSTGGRITGIVLMFSGIGLFLYVASRIASQLLEHEESDVAQITRHFDHELATLRKDVMDRLDELSTTHEAER